MRYFSVRASTITIAITTTAILATAPSTVQGEAQIMIRPGLPLTSELAKKSVPGMVEGFYRFALLTGGLLAFGAIVYGAARYTLAAGNSSGQGDARDQITQALLGLLLLLGAYLVLFTINPNLTKLSLPALRVPILPPEGTGGAAARGCLNCKNLREAGFECKHSPCLAHPSIVAALECMRNNGVKVRITEAYPPTVGHSSPNHRNGCAIDFTVDTRERGCDDVKAAVNLAARCGLAVVGEYHELCAGQKMYGCKYTTTGKDHIHAEGCGKPAGVRGRDCPTAKRK